MESIKLIFLILPYLARTIRNLLFQVFLWQLKEYRLDRMRAHLSTLQGRRWLINPSTISRWALFLVSPLLVGQGRGGIVFPFLVTALFIIEMASVIKQLLARQVKHPKFTAKASLIVGGVGLLQILPLGGWLLTDLPFEMLAFLLLGLAVFLPIFVSGTTAVLAPATLLAKKKIIATAKEKIETHPGLIVVGITGSFGKTSTKEFLATILSEKFSVLFTAEHHNTNIGIAQCILAGLKKSHQVFIVEMGAYKKGEIAEICDFVHPQIGVITGINPQHLALFGSMKNLLEAKFELIEALPQDGLAVFNGDDAYCLGFHKKTKVPKMLYSQKKKLNLTADKILVGKDNLEFRVTTKGAGEKFNVPLIGRHNISNILAAVSVALHLEMSLKEIARAAGKLKAVGQTLVVSPGPNGLRLIDDTYNANPDGVMAALEYLTVYSGKKILVLQPMIELGEATPDAHRRVGREAIKVCDLIILTNKNFFSSFVEKIKKSDKEKITVEPNPQMAALKLKKLLGRNDVVLFEGKEAEKTLKELKIKK